MGDQTSEEGRAPLTWHLTPTRDGTQRTGSPLFAHQGAEDGSGTVALSPNRSPPGLPSRLEWGTLAISVILLRLAWYR